MARAYVYFSVFSNLTPLIPLYNLGEGEIKLKKRGFAPS
jgi:hypothetical protein